MYVEKELGVRMEAPVVLVAPVKRPELDDSDGEAAKYQKMWEHKEYRTVAPGEQAALQFLQQSKPLPADTVIDFGAGTGRGALILAILGRLDVTMLDFAPNCLDADIQAMLVPQAASFRFREADLRLPFDFSAKYGYCTDVMEHIPTKDVDAVLHNILNAAEHVFFQISLVDDALGALIGEPLHLTVKPFSWWLAKLVMHDATVHWFEHDSNVASFYVTAWNNATEVVKKGVVNTVPEEIQANIRSAVTRRLNSIQPHDRQNTRVMILAGGPSMNDFRSEIMAKRADGMPLITLNGAYNWAIENGLKPSAQIVVDAREFNNRFVSHTVDTCKYMIASQCHPSVFDAIPAEQTLMWHAGISDEVYEYLNTLYAELDAGAWFPTPGGSTVMLRALPLLRMLGYWQFDIYGFDSCLMGDAHHAYAQAENDQERIIKVTCGGRVFNCHPWMVSQAQEFLDLMRRMADELNLEVHGDGLIHHILETAALGEEDSGLLVEDPGILV